MSQKILLPVFPSDRFYDAVVRAGDVVKAEGGLITFLFTKVRPPEAAYEAVGADGNAAELDIDTDLAEEDGTEPETWRAAQVAGLEEARALLTERGISEGQINYLFADEAETEGAAQAIADEAAAGAYDLVMLSRGYFEDEVVDEEATPGEIAEAIKAIDGVKVVVA